jgi:hypothetical protein
MPHDVGLTVDPFGGPVLTMEHGSAGPVRPLDDAGVDQDGEDGIPVQVLVLGGEGVDGGRDDNTATMVAALRNVLRACEDERRHALEVRLEEVPA